MNKLLQAIVYLCPIFHFIFYSSTNLFAQTSKSTLYKVLTLTGEKQGARDLPQDHGIIGMWQKLLKLQTTASVLHTQAHPDDEQADLLTYLSRGRGVRTAFTKQRRKWGKCFGQRIF